MKKNLETLLFIIGISITIIIDAIWIVGGEDSIFFLTGLLILIIIAVVILILLNFKSKSSNDDLKLPIDVS